EGVVPAVFFRPADYRGFRGAADRQGGYRHAVAPAYLGGGQRRSADPRRVHASRDRPRYRRRSAIVFLVEAAGRSPDPREPGPARLGAAGPLPESRERIHARAAE